MKKLIALLIVLVMLCSVAACGNQSAKNGEKPTDAVETTVPTVDETDSIEETDPVEETDPAEDMTPNPAIQAYMEQNGEELLAGLAEGLATNGFTCTNEWAVVGNGINVTVCIQELENLSDEQKIAIAEALAALQELLNGTIEALRAEMPELERCDFFFCDKNGEILVVLTIQ